MYGPGPFEVLAIVDRDGGEALLVKTESREREIEAAWIGPAHAVPGCGSCEPEPFGS